MEIMEKLKILSDAAKYDVSCSSSGSKRKNRINGLGNAAPSGICHSWAADGRCISLLKILMTNYCIYDCEYCVNRHSNDIVRTHLSPEEVVGLTVQFYRRNYIEGLFLSSGIIKSPDYTTELLIKIAKTLRLKENFNGYIHMKGIPGTDSMLIYELGKYVDRMSINMELPSESSLKLLAPQKTRSAIITPMQFIKNKLTERQEEKHLVKYVPSFIPAGQTTQMIIGASGENDRHILKLSEALYKKVSLKRVYYSAYVPVMTGKNLPALQVPPLLRENRLYQADWLLRYYHFSADEILTADRPNFDLSVDPKTNWALQNWHIFPVEINRAPYEMLLRVPGIGVRSAMRIRTLRRFGNLSYDELRHIGIVWKRARHFITCSGKYYGLRRDDPLLIKKILLSQKSQIIFKQFSLFEGQV
ncbi:putative DNA modification/repair radical SAM protein [Pectinatus frisingensis]|jgi:putative DNA modification/repair radical SAM protein|uniref:putative DNA modification/repair radical SAM protein n=1 Tax=Pectinatus frisingensis TaxID=865 RepID=UPI0015F391F0|nr:putative DNA modification/repair radical SAM protein [Pectinatus frisingensis]